MQERHGRVTFKGNPLTLIGPEVKVGSQTPGFQVLGQDLAPVTLASFKGKTLLISVVPSLDTPVCDAQTRRFNQEAAALPNVAILTVSMDLPFAQKRWCGSAGVDRVTVLSDHRDASFGTAYGALIKELRLLCRAIFVVDRGGTVRHVEYVSELSAHPNYDAALAALRQLTATA
ncbi:MAG: thiol peroxidase [Candidatus Omnitrophica bacterium]|nr:thiol peroxidase [Candidatus Omnitrophota bacterium]MBI3020920.1 thiol peroxidase [Candidatus Omnitrophota bacterium]MBI3083999.1 thiol peroxidase [Candidatus Omnitrophota bacterium]